MTMTQPSSCPLAAANVGLNRRFGRRLPAALGVIAAALATAFLAATADAQVMVVEPLRPVTTGYAPMAAPMAAGFPGGYVANYSPAGNYAAVTAFSPPLATSYVAGYPVTQVANYAVEAAPAPVAVTAGYAPVAVTAYSPVAVSAYSPVVSAPVAVTSYSPVMAAPAVAAPVTTYYAPAYAPAVAVPLYRRGPFGGLRPVRSAMYIPY
ncbi:MAG: hypothetical protein RLZZ111_434 [Planctomycetota bacterium]|jgi:hypothetical protein